MPSMEQLYRYNCSTDNTEHLQLIAALDSLVFRAKSKNHEKSQVLSSAAKPGTHFLEKNKTIVVFTMLKLCVSKEWLAY